MPVVGLPTTVELALESLLAEKSLSSWKITGQGDTTVVVLRLRSEGNFQHGDHDAAKHNQYYRRKNPSQLRRDQQRAQQRIMKKSSQLQASELNATASPFIPTIDKEHLLVDIENRPIENNTTPGVYVLPSHHTCVSPEPARDTASVLHSKHSHATDLILPTTTTFDSVLRGPKQVGLTDPTPAEPSCFSFWTTSCQGVCWWNSGQNQTTTST